MTQEQYDALQEEIRKAGKAAIVFENEAFKEAVANVEQALLAAMRSAPIAEDKLRLRLLDKYESLFAIVGELKSAVDTGKLAQEQLSIWEKAKKAMGVN